MNETGITFYIHDLDISDKSRRFLTHAGIIRLDDFLNLDINGLYAMSGINVYCASAPTKISIGREIKILKSSTVNVIPIDNIMIPNTIA